ncbi:MAG: hypothetical protein DIAAKJNI_00058 [Candidatus Argoarchaeum ethanivorans]|uniref:Uncharacterized protein n=1 Tax=Candidatus Argoarchaeum ethanivorans TaxID=2608793 RepID=A0A811T5B1_9EURY|nr:MAG: hypothetical protein DIAAKJNI_00058 [Candidatus Argoarchaeum ethanivorans]
MRTIDFPFKAIDKLTFSPRPQPLPASLRPLYRIALITLVLKTNCQSNTASMLKLQFFNWLLKSSSLQELIEDRLTHQSVFTLELIHLDPMVTLALKYAVADNLISVTNNSKYKLTDKGHKFADLILRDEQSVLAGERRLLIRIGQRVPEERLRKELL